MGGGQTTQSSTQQTVPAYLQAGQTQEIAQASNLSQTPFQQYTGQMVSPLAPQQQQYFANVSGNQGAWQPGLNASNQTVSNIAGGQYTPNVTPTTAATQNVSPNSISSNMSQYYDPAVNTELGGESAAINQQTQMNQANANRNLGAQGAFGYSGQNIQDAQIAQNGQLAMGQYAAQLLPQAFNQAGQLSNQDIQNQLSAVNQNNTANLQSNLQNYEYQQLGEQGSLGAGQLAEQAGQQLGTNALAAQQAGYADASQLGTSGQAQQNQAQAYLNFPYQQYLSAQQWPYQTLAAESSALGTVAPYAGGTSTQSAPYSPFASTIGTALAGTAAVNSLMSKRGGKVHKAEGGNVISPPQFNRLKRVQKDGGGGIPEQIAETDPNYNPNSAPGLTDSQGNPVPIPGEKPINAQAPVQGAPVQGAPVQGAPVQGAPVQGAPAAPPNQTGPLGGVGRLLGFGSKQQTQPIMPVDPNASPAQQQYVAAMNRFNQASQPTAQDKNNQMMMMGASLMQAGKPPMRQAGQALEQGIGITGKAASENALAYHAKAAGLGSLSETAAKTAGITSAADGANITREQLLAAYNNRRGSAGTAQNPPPAIGPAAIGQSQQGSQ